MIVSLAPKRAVSATWAGSPLYDHPPSPLPNQSPRGTERAPCETPVYSGTRKPELIIITVYTHTIYAYDMKFCQMIHMLSLLTMLGFEECLNST